jgi:quercetin dioxygenase-like cupin family protein
MVLENKGTEEKDKQKVVRLTDIVEYEKGTFVSKTIINKKAVSVDVFAVDQFQGIIEHVLPYEALFYVLEGEAEVNLSGKTYTVEPGEMMLFPANKPHAIRTKSQFKMLLVSFKE